MKVFVSHSSKDADFVKRLCGALEASQDPTVDCWMSGMDLQAGERWTREISRQIKQCDRFVVVISNDSVQSEWVEKEIALAVKHGKPILPYFVDEVDLPEGFDVYLHTVQNIAGFRMGEADGFAQLLAALTDAKPPPATSRPNSRGVSRNWAKAIGGTAAFLACAVTIGMGVGGPDFFRNLLGVSGGSRPLPPPQSEATISLQGGGVLKAMVDPAVRVGGKAKLILQATRDVHVQVLHLGAETGFEEFQNDLPVKKPGPNDPPGMEIVFAADPPAGTNYFLIYGSPEAYREREEKFPSGPNLSPNRAYELRPTPVSGNRDAVKFGVIGYESFDP